jgi:hypothetical protein
VTRVDEVSGLLRDLAVPMTDDELERLLGRLAER